MSQFLISSYGLERKSKTELQKIYSVALGIWPDEKWKKRELIGDIRAAIEEDRERRFLEASTPAQRENPCEITASEVNDWLQTLPTEAV